jgi:hypothetical protein
MAIRHAFVSEQADESDESLVRPSDWNAEHVGVCGGAIFSQIWTNSTRPAAPDTDLIGYNTEEQRPELYVLAEGQWYYLWEGKIGAPPPTAPAIFADDFESGWFVIGPFSERYADNFESGWFIDRVFNSLFAEDFEGVW